MTSNVQPHKETVIRKDRRCHDCHRKFPSGTIMVSSVWAEDGIYRLYECRECYQWIMANPKIANEVFESENALEGWMKEVEPLPEHLIAK